MRLRKIGVVLLLLIFLMPLISSVTIHGGELIDDETKARLEKAEKDAGIMEGFMIGQANNLFSIGGVNSINNLIFGNPYDVWMSTDEPMQFGLFYESELDSFIIPLIKIFAGCFISFIALAIMISSLKLGLKAYSPQAKADLWEDVQMWIMSAFFMGLFWWISQIIFSLNDGFVQSVYNLATNHMGVDLNGLSIIATAGSFSLGDIIVFLVEWGLALYLNIIYISRKIIIVLLIILAPVAAISLLYAKTRSFFGSWIKEFCGNVFLQSIHALVMAIFCGLAMLGAGTVFKIGMLLMFIPVTGMVTKWLNLGDSSSSLGRAAGMAGLAGVTGAAMLMRRAGGVVKGRGSYQAGGAPAEGGDSQGSDNNPTSITEAAKGNRSNGWQRVKGGLGFAGAAAGAAVGLGFGGPGGAIAGGMIGQGAFRGAGQMGRNIYSGAKSATQTLGSITAQGESVNLGSSYSAQLASKGYQFGSGLKNVWKDTESRRKHMGNMGESLGSMVGAGNAGRMVGNAMSGVSQNRIMAQNYGGKTLADYEKQNPGAAVQWRQDNQGSAFYMQQGESWKQISPTGAANPSLKKNEVLRVDYSLGGVNSSGEGSGSTVIYGANSQPISQVNTSGSSVHGDTGGQGQVRIMPGSTPNLQRTSEPYVQGIDGKKFTDQRVDAKTINPDNYFSHNVLGSPDRRHGTDKFADRVSGTNTQNLDNLKSWAQDTKQRRHSGVV